MGKFVLILAAVIGVVVIGGAGFLLIWDIPAPKARVERVIPDQRFPR